MPDWLINHPLVHHFLRGLNDGDGSFFIQKEKNKKTNQIKFNLCGTSMLLEQVKSIFKKEGLINSMFSRGKKNIRQKSGCSCLEFGGNIIISKIFDYLYKDATIYLQRKYDIAKLAKEYSTNKQQYYEKDIKESIS